MIRIFGHHDQRTVDQLVRCVQAEEGAIGALCADGHLGYSMPIGGVVGYREHISPSGVGYDIGCGNKAVLTDLVYEDIRPHMAVIMDEIYDRISFGVGRKNDEPVDHPVLDLIANAPFKPQRALQEVAAKQLGTVGAGNHYVDLFHDDNDRIWIGVHFGSRGFGHKTASGFLALHQQEKYRASRPDIPWNGPLDRHFFDKASEGEMESPPVLFKTDSYLGQAYIEAMTLAGKYAYAGRDVVCDKVLGILGARSMYEIHNHHNFAWYENHGGANFWVVRKGATPAWPGQEGFVGATMGEDSVILQGAIIDMEYFLDHITEQEQALFSTVHGAGRALSRTQAAGKRGNRAECQARDCEFWVPWQVYQRRRAELGLAEHERFSMCPDHPTARMKKRRGRIKPGVIDYDAVQKELRQKGIELRGGAADEAPGAYKRLSDVLEAHAGTITIQHRLTPIGVAMADANTFDPFKDG